MITPRKNDDVTISVLTSKYCQISVNIVLVSDRFEKNWYQPTLNYNTVALFKGNFQLKSALSKRLKDNK